MAIKPWMTSEDLISAVKRKISFPISQNTFSEDDILAFLNEEMLISQVPSVMSFHEEYYVDTVEVPLLDGISTYQIPNRAIGMKLRDLFYKDQSGNLFEMTRIAEDDRAFFQSDLGANGTIHKFFLQGNNIVLRPQVQFEVTGSLLFVYFLRPNQLVANNRAAIIESFTKKVIIDNSSISAGDKLYIDNTEFTAVSGVPSANEFQIGVSSIATATNLTSAINANGVLSANNGSPSTNTVKLSYSNLSLAISSDSLGISVQSLQGIEFNSIPDNITNGSVIDFLQTKPGHKIYKYDITLSSSAISGNNIEFNPSDIPSELLVGDYVCSEYECIIPQLPPDLHNGLAERACARILAAIGDQAGLATINQKLQEVEARQGQLLDNRVEGAPIKIRSRNSLLSLGKMGWRRYF